MLYKVVLYILRPIDEALSTSVSIQMKTIGQYFLVVLFIMLYKIVLTLKLWKKIPSSGFLWFAYCVLLCLF